MTTRAGTVKYYDNTLSKALLHFPGSARREIRRILRHLVSRRHPLHPPLRRPHFLRQHRP